MSETETNFPENWSELSDEEKREWLAKATKKGESIKVTVDTEGIQEIIKRNRELEEQLEEKTTEAEDYESKLKLVAEEKLNIKRKKLDLPETNPSTGEAWTVEELKAISDSRPKDDRNVGAGNIPLTPQQTGHVSKGEEFESHKAMVDYLSELERSPDPEKRASGKALKEELFRKQIEGMKDPDYKGFKLEIEKPITEWQLLQKRKAKEESE